MTAKTARNKWCPFVRLLTVAGSEVHEGFNRAIIGNEVIEVPTATTCITSKCMFWTGSGCGLMRSKEVSKS